MLQINALNPRDEHNTRLESLVHPRDWVNLAPKGRYNLVVIGAGTAGLVTAAGAAGLGAKMALVERGLLGSDCLNVGCVPSKSLISAARAATAVRDAAPFGVRVPDGTRVDFPAVMERLRRLRASLALHDSAERFRSLGVTDTETWRRQRDACCGRKRFRSLGVTDTETVGTLDDVPLLRRRQFQRSQVCRRSRRNRGRDLGV